MSVKPSPSDFQLSPAAEAVIDRLKACGHTAYPVGGCVRDTLMHKTPHDWDLTTPALPEEILEAFRDQPEFEAIPTGIVHGTVTVLAHHEPVEVTTFRVDGIYSDSRRPDSVRFTRSLKEDLARRDFTVNAMAWSAEDGILDPFGGRADLEEGIIRCVGDPRTRFGEDALRILRALRFASVLGFSIDPPTREAALALRESLRRISRERICTEFGKLLTGQNAASVLAECEPILYTLFPSAVFDRALIQALAGRPLSSFLASLRLNSRSLKPMRFDGKTCARVDLLDSAYDREIRSERDFCHLCRDIGTEAAGELIAIQLVRGILPEEAGEWPVSVLNSNKCVSVSQLAVGGRELLALGLPPKSVGTVLNRLLSDVIDGLVPNDPDALLSRAAGYDHLCERNS